MVVFICTRRIARAQCLCLARGYCGDSADGTIHELPVISEFCWESCQAQSDARGTHCVLLPICLLMGTEGVSSLELLQIMLL